MGQIVMLGVLLTAAPAAWTAALVLHLRARREPERQDQWLEFLAWELEQHEARAATLVR